MTTLAQIREYLPLPKLMYVKDRYRREEAMRYMTGVLPLVYDHSRDYNAAIAGAFYGRELPSDLGPSFRSALSVPDRERCLIALLCSRGGGDTLASHIYLALMEGVSPEEIANVMMLTGMYAGVDQFVNGLKIEITTLVTLGKMVDQNEAVDAPSVLRRLTATFDPYAR